MVTQKNKPVLIDTFAGLGGFSLGGHWADIETVAFVEKDENCKRVLNKNFPGVPVYSDIKDQNWINEIKAKYNTIDIITGGFPCQPVSTAGLRKGVQDDRYLWPPLFKAVQRLRPRAVLFENVAGLASLGIKVQEDRVETKKIIRLPESDLYEKVFSQQKDMLLSSIIKDLEKAKYGVICFIVPALGIGAPHKRDRVWICGFDLNSSGPANVPHLSREGLRAGMGVETWEILQTRWDEIISQYSSPDQPHPPHSSKVRPQTQFQCGQQQTGGEEIQEKWSIFERTAPEGFKNDPSHSSQLHRQWRPKNPGWGEIFQRETQSLWDIHWAESAANLCGVDDGLSPRVDKGELSYSARFKMLGNSICPQVAWVFLLLMRDVIKLFYHNDQNTSIKT